VYRKIETRDFTIVLKLCLNGLQKTSEPEYYIQNFGNYFSQCKGKKS
jgi:hypothetical protein